MFSPPVAVYESKALQTLNVRTRGIDLTQWSMLTKNQFLWLVGKLEPFHGQKILDVGSGYGRIAAEIQKRLDAQVTGIDLYPSMLDPARKAFGDKVTFLEMNYEALTFPEGSFDALYAVDSLYFTEKLPKVVPALYRCLRPGGGMAIFWSQPIPPDGDPAILQPDRTAVASILNTEAIPYVYTEFTEEDLELWTRANSALHELKADLLRDGMEEETWKMRYEESGNVLATAQQKRQRRYAYWIEKNTLSEPV